MKIRKRLNGSQQYSNIAAADALAWLVKEGANKNTSGKYYYITRIIRDIIDNYMTQRQGEMFGMYYLKNMTVIDISNALERNKSTVSREINRGRRYFDKNLNQYAVNHITVICGDELLGEYVEVFKKKKIDTPDDENNVPSNDIRSKNSDPNPYAEMSEQYEETIAFIERRISQLREKLKSPSLSYLERKPIYQRIKTLEDELAELHSDAHTVTKYI